MLCPMEVLRCCAPWRCYGAVPHEGATVLCPVEVLRCCALWRCCAASVAAVSPDSCCCQTLEPWSGAANMLRFRAFSEGGSGLGGLCRALGWHSYGAARGLGLQGTLEKSVTRRKSVVFDHQFQVFAARHHRRTAPRRRTARRTAPFSARSPHLPRIPTAAHHRTAPPHRRTVLGPSSPSPPHAHRTAPPPPHRHRRTILGPSSLPRMPTTAHRTTAPPPHRAAAPFSAPAPHLPRTPTAHRTTAPPPQARAPHLPACPPRTVPRAPFSARAPHLPACPARLRTAAAPHRAQTAVFRGIYPQMNALRGMYK